MYVPIFRRRRLPSTGFFLLTRIIIVTEMVICSLFIFCGRFSFQIRPILPFFFRTAQFFLYKKYKYKEKICSKLRIKTEIKIISYRISNQILPSLSESSEASEYSESSSDSSSLSTSDGYKHICKN